MTATPSRTLLVVADNPDTQTVILEHARAKGHSVIAATTPALGLTTFDMTQPDIVIMDLFLPDQEGMTLVKQIRERRPTCPVVLLTDAGHDDSTMEGLRAGALDYMQQPIHEEAFAQVLQRAIHSLPASVDDAPGVERLEYVLVMGPDTNYVESTVTWLIQGTAMGLMEARQLHLRAALQELVMNAVEHGCLELRYRDKIEAMAKDQYDALIQQRRQDVRFRDRRVTIRAIYDKREQTLTYQIADDGKGFNWKSRGNLRLDACPTGDASGRGIFLTQSFFPDLRYNEKGNEVTFAVRLG
ncbi:MAG: response regulator [Nitrospirota bacterium]|nr:response regulator [Nitrospirota bacterium]MDP2382829.1 response regulator [Nitrospirota bacterium]